MTIFTYILFSIHDIKSSLTLWG